MNKGWCLALKVYVHQSFDLRRLAREVQFIVSLERLDPRDRSMVYASAGQRGYLLRAGLEAALRGEATGSSRAFRADAVAVAKKPLKAGEKLDGSRA